MRGDRKMESSSMLGSADCACGWALLDSPDIAADYPAFNLVAGMLEPVFWDWHGANAETSRQRA